MPREATHPAVVGSIAMFPPMIVSPILMAPNITPKEVCGSLGKRPRLNLSNRSDRGNSMTTKSHASVNIFETTERLAPEVP